jgi:hypothetical protein
VLGEIFTGKWPWYGMEVYKREARAMCNASDSHITIRRKTSDNRGKNGSYFKSVIPDKGRRFRQSTISYRESDKQSKLNQNESSPKFGGMPKIAIVDITEKKNSSAPGINGIG